MSVSEHVWVQSVTRTQKFIAYVNIAARRYSLILFLQGLQSLRAVGRHRELVQHVHAQVLRTAGAHAAGGHTAAGVPGLVNVYRPQRASALPLRYTSW